MSTTEERVHETRDGRVIKLEEMDTKHLYAQRALLRQWIKELEDSWECQECSLMVPTEMSACPDCGNNLCECPSCGALGPVGSRGCLRCGNRFNGDDDARIRELKADLRAISSELRRRKKR
jgi:hypothetical protein